MDRFEFHALLKRWEERERSRMIGLAQILTAIGNVFRKKPLTVEQRFPDLFPRVPDTPEAMRDKLRAWAGGGQKKK